MKLNLLGSSYPAYSPAVSVQQSMNCFLESVEAAEGKSQLVLRGRPGITLFADLVGYDAAATPVRGLWSGGGRLFVIAGTKQFEIDSGGGSVGVNTIAADSHPAIILGNGNQLVFTSNGIVYCDNGAGPVQVVFPALSGQAVTDGARLLTRVDTPNSTTGHKDSFDAGMLLQTIVWGAVTRNVSGVINDQLVQLNATVSPTAAGTIADWASTPVLGASTLAFLDGFFFVPRTGTRQVNGSNFMDGSTWDPLTVAIKEGYPDNVQALWSEPPLLYVLGTETLEVWRDTGAAPFPLERVDGGFARVGLAATWSCASIMGKLHMLAGGSYGKVVAVRMEGVNPVRISTHAVEEAWKAYGFPFDGWAYSYIDRGHLNWVINLAGGKSWIYDATESARLGSPQWHERCSYSGGAFTSYLPQFHTFVPEWGSAGKHIVGGGASGKLYVQDAGTYDDNGTDIRYVRTMSYVYKEDFWLYHHRVEFEFETGTAATPMVVTLDWTDDRGQTFGTGLGAGTSIALGPGVVGKYSTRYFARALGRSRGRTYRITVQGKGRLALIDASVEVSEGTA